MRLASPEWLLLMPALWVAGRLFPALGLSRPLRALAVFALVFALAGPERSTRSAGLDLWVLVDRSDSASSQVAESLPEWQGILREGRGPGDRLFWVDFAAEPQVHEDGEPARFEGRTDRTRLGLGLQVVASQMDPRRANRALVLSDGYVTDALSGVAQGFVAAEAPIDVRFVEAPSVDDTWVAHLDAPERVAEGAPALLEVEIGSTRSDDVQLVLERDGLEIHRGRVRIRRGVGRARLVDRPVSPGAHRYTARIEGVQGGLSGNDEESRWVEVAGAPRILLVTHYPTGPLAAALARSGFEVEVLADPGALHIGKLSGARALVIEDVPAHRIPKATLDALPFWVQAQGGGLMMVGGRSSFGSGGYFESAIDPVLPVSMELRQEHRKLAVAMAIVLDRSGSMAARVPSPRGPVTKMELANDASARAVELLGGRDQVAVLAVDSEAHVVVPRVALSTAREEVLGALRRINSQGGGIFVYEGLAAAWKELEPAQIGQRHVILFSDAADSEVPGDYAALLAKMRKAGATVSVIGLGTEKDVDAALLKDIAERGGGRIFFTDAAADLPALFAQETVAVARSVFVTDPVSLASTAGWLQLAPRAMRWPPVVDAYNLTYAREGATIAARTQDEQSAPLVAFWQHGRGRSAAVLFPLAGEGSASARDWPGYGDFASTLARWLAGNGVPPGVALLTTRRGQSLQLELRHDSAWDEVVAKRAPRMAIARGGETFEPTWSRVGPGRWSATVELPRQGYLRGVVQVGSANLPFGPAHAPRGEEWKRDEGARKRLLALVRATGGARRARLGEVWRAPRPPRFDGFSGLFVALGLGLLLADAFVERAGLRLPELAWPERLRAAPRAAAPVEPAPSEPESPSIPFEEPSDMQAGRRRARLSRAKRGR